LPHVVARFRSTRIHIVRRKKKKKKKRKKKKKKKREKNEKYRWECKERRRQKWIREEEIKWNEIALKESKKSSSMSTKVMRAKKFEKKQAIMAGTRESERTNHALPREYCFSKRETA